MNAEPRVILPANEQPAPALLLAALQQQEVTTLESVEGRGESPAATDTHTLTHTQTDPQTCRQPAAAAAPVGSLRPPRKREKKRGGDIIRGGSLLFSHH